MHTSIDDGRPGFDLLRQDLVDSDAAAAPGRQVDRDLVARPGTGQPEGQRFVGREKILGQHYGVRWCRVADTESSPGFLDFAGGNVSIE